MEKTKKENFLKTISLLSEITTREKFIECNNVVKDALLFGHDPEIIEFVIDEVKKIDYMVNKEIESDREIINYVIDLQNFCTFMKVVSQVAIDLSSKKNDELSFKEKNFLLIKGLLNSKSNGVIQEFLKEL